MTEPLPPRGEWTAEVLSRLPEDNNLAEVLDGQLNIVYHNEDSHCIALWSLALIVAPYAWGENLDFTLGPKPFRFSERCEMQPDITVVPRTRIKGGRATDDPSKPELFIEIATPHSRSVDAAIKSGLYIAFGVKTYWVVDYTAREVAVWSNGRQHSETFTESVMWSPRRSEQQLTIDLPKYFDAIPEFDCSHDSSGPWIRRIRNSLPSSGSAP